MDTITTKCRSGTDCNCSGQMAGTSRFLITIYMPILYEYLDDAGSKAVPTATSNSRFSFWYETSLPPRDEI